MTLAAVPSQSPVDLLLNAQKLDEAISSGALSYVDRLGVPRMTLAGAVETLKAFNYRGAWVTATAYSLKDVVSVSGVAYVCTVAHTSSGAFATDQASKWVVHQGATQQQLNGYVAGEANRPLREVAGVLRKADAGSSWAYLNDADHAPVGMGAVSVVGDALRTTYSFVGYKVTSVFGGADETMASRGLTFGGSVGVDYTNWSLFMPFAAWVEKNAGAFSFGNIDPWLGPGSDTTIALTSGVTDGSSFTITHKTASGDDPPVASILRGNAIPSIDVSLSYGGTSIRVDFVEEMHGYIYFDGTTWQVQTPNSSKPTMSFSAGVLTVSHEDIGDIYDTHITGVGGSLVVTAGTPSGVAATRATSFLVTFQDYAGAAVTSASTNMKFHYRRPRLVRTVPPNGVRVSVRRGSVLLNPNSVNTATGNLWVRGILELAP